MALQEARKQGTFFISATFLMELCMFHKSFRTIGVIAPAGPVKKEKVTDAVAFMESFGVRVVIGGSILKNDDAPYLSASAEARLQDLNGMIRNPEVDLICCLRGGYGSVHLLDQVDWETFRKRNLPLIGYSDITALHLAMIRQKAGIPIAAHMALTFRKEFENKQFCHSFRRACALAAGERGTFRKCGRLISCGVKSPDVSGRLHCANLTVMTSLCGTAHLPSMRGRILVLEDIGEPVRKLDRNLMQLKQNGIFDECAAVVFGSYKNCGSVADRSYLFENFAKSIPVPCFSGLRFGHCANSLSFICGEEAEISAGILKVCTPEL